MNRVPVGPVWFDGRTVPIDEAVISVVAPAVQYGLGLFETLAVDERRILDLDEHLARLAAAAPRLGLDLPARDVLRGAAREIGGAAVGGRAWLKIVLLQPAHCAVFGGPLEEAEGRPARGALLPWRRNPADPLNGLKTLNYAANQLGLAWARERDADEGLWLNVRGHLAEGCTSNLFVLDGRRLFTPAVRDGVLPGIVRRHVLQAARERGYTVHEGKIRLRRLQGAAETFLSSSLRGLRPLVALDGRPLGAGARGGTALLAAAVRERRLERSTQC